MFVDTSAFFAVADAADPNHLRARDLWVRTIEQREELICTNYVIVETIALLQRRLGIAAVLAFAADVVPIITIVWMDSDAHGAALAAVLTAGRRDLSLVDCASFGTMRRFSISRAFAFDADFVEQGFECVP